VPAANKNPLGAEWARWPGAETAWQQQEFVVNVGDRVFFETTQD